MKKQVKTLKTTPVAPKAKTAKSVAPAPASPWVEISKRVTPGAAIDEWRIVRSQRAKTPGWFLQGGSYSFIGARNCFPVSQEIHFGDRAAALSALAERKPKPAAA